MSYRERIGNASNKYQNQHIHRRVLCICQGGLLRSPTAAFVLSQPPYNHNTRAVGINSEYALILLDDALFHWADEIVVMESEIERHLKPYIERQDEPTPIINLEIPDNYPYRDPALIELIKEKYNVLTGAHKTSHTQYTLNYIYE